jgi:flagellar motor protein MotB
VEGDFEQNLEDNYAKSQAWMLSFVDTLSILITFFILVYATHALSPPPKKVSTSSKGDPINITQDGTDLDYLELILKNNLKDYNLIEQIYIHNNEENLVLSIPSDKLFKYNSNDFLINSTKILDFLEDNLINIDNSITINGIDCFDYLNTNYQLIDKFKLPLNQALALNRKIKEFGYNNNLEIYSYNGSKYKLHNTSTKMNLLQRIDIIIHDFKV